MNESYPSQQIGFEDSHLHLARPPSSVQVVRPIALPAAPIKNVCILVSYCVLKLFPCYNFAFHLLFYSLFL